MLICTVVLVLPATLSPSVVATAKTSILQRPSLISKSISSSKSNDAYQLLARSIQNRLNAPTDSDESSPTKYDIDTISSALRSLSTTQSALKKIDGTAHEMYQRTHKSSTSLDDESDDEDNNGYDGKVGGLKVKGRMSRNAARVGCLADALFAAELCELIKMAPPAMILDDGDAAVDGDEKNEVDTNDIVYSEDGTLASWTGRKVVLNTTIHSDTHANFAISVLVIYEPHYDGGAGIKHGGVDDLLSFAKEEIEDEDENSDDESISNAADVKDVQNARGRYLVILSDHRGGSSPSSSSSSCDLPSIISILDTPPRQLRLKSKVGDDYVSASVCDSLYEMAGEVIKVIQPVIMNKHCDATSKVSEGSDEETDESTDPRNEAIHFVGYSLAGSIGAISANILDGVLPLQHKGSGGKRQQSSVSGSCHDRTSALCLGPPPCISSNLESPYITSVIHGDDIVCRTTHNTINHLCDRLHRSIKGGLLGRSVGWMSEAVSLTVSGLKSDKDKNGKLVLPGNVYLIRPRRIGGGSSSIHEVAGSNGRDSLRANLLWQLNDILLSKSLWTHHRLESYIRSLDKVRLKGFADDDSSQNGE